MRKIKFNDLFFQKLISRLDKTQLLNIFDILVFSMVVGIAFYQFGPNLDATWWVIDDHEIMNFSPANHQLDFRELIPTLISKTEINPNSTLARFRPVYYFFRLFETRLWLFSGAPGWYFARILIFIFFISVLYLIFRKMNGRIIGSLLAIYVTTFKFLPDIFSRLGPSESYAILGFSIFMTGILIFIRRKDRNFAWFVMMLGVIISMGSKENMGIFVLPFVFCFIYYLTTKPEKKIIPWITQFVTISFTIWIYVTIYHRIRMNGMDIYQNSVSLSVRLNTLISFIGNNLWINSIIVGFLMISFLGLVFARNSSVKVLFSWSFWGGAFIISLFISQVIFYSGSFWGRYNFPFSLYIPFTICLIVHFFQQLSLNLKKHIYYYLVSIAAVIGVCFLTKPVHWQEIREISNQNVNRTHYFETKLNSIKLYLMENPDAALILYGNNPNSDYEISISYSRFLRSELIENEIFILRDPPENFETTFSGLSTKLEKRLLDFSKNGSEIYGISQLAKFSNKSKKCLLVNLEVDHEAPLHCDEVIDGNLSIKYIGLYSKKK